VIDAVQKQKFSACSHTEPQTQSQENKANWPVLTLSLLLHYF
jgi:hypothetical protein